MSRRRDPRRGRHKGARSPETLRFERELLIPPRPAYLPPATYRALAELRAELDGRRGGR